MLLLHEVHRVAGAQEEAFEAAYRDELIPALAKTDGCRLLWFLRVAHGSGPAYTVVTIIGCRDAAAWAELAERIRHGDLAEWSAEVDAMRHACEAKILTPVSWSPAAADRPGDRARRRATAHELSLFMEDTAWPFPGGLHGLPGQGGHALRPDAELPEAGGPGHHRARGRLPARLRIAPHQRGDPLAARGQPQGAPLPARPTTSRPRPPRRGPGCTTRSTVRDRWESRILRSAEWSPLY